MRHRGTRFFRCSPIPRGADCISQSTLSNYMALFDQLNAPARDRGEPWLTKHFITYKLDLQTDLLHHPGVEALLQTGLNGSVSVPFEERFPITDKR